MKPEGGAGHSSRLTRVPTIRVINDLITKKTSPSRPLRAHSALLGSHQLRSCSLWEKNLHFCRIFQASSNLFLRESGPKYNAEEFGGRIIKFVQLQGNFGDSRKTPLLNSQKALRNKTVVPVLFVNQGLVRARGGIQFQRDNVRTGNPDCCSQVPRLYSSVDDTTQQVS